MNIVSLRNNAVYKVAPVAEGETVMLTEKAPRVGSLRNGPDDFCAPSDAVQVRNDGTIESLLANKWAADQAGDGWRDVPHESVTANMVWNGEAFVIPPPKELTAEEKRAAMPELNTVQMEAMLQISGKKEAVYAALDAIADPVQRVVAKAYLEKSTRYRRMFPLTEQMRAAVGLTPEELDALWLQATMI